MHKIFTKEQVKELLDVFKSERLVTFVEKFKKDAAANPEAFGKFRMIVTTESMDRAGDIVSVDGWELDNYLKNPIVLWAHDYGGLPIGVTESITKEGNGLVAEGYFAPGEANPQAQQVRKLYDLGMINTASVGFIPLEFDPNGQTERGGQKIIKQELLEWSFVPVPANAEALNLLKAHNMDAKELITKGFLKAEESAPPVPQVKTWDETDAACTYVVKDVAEFDDTTLHTTTFQEEPKIESVVGKIKGEDTESLQSLIFPKDAGWTLETAQKWVADNEANIGKAMQNLTRSMQKGYDVKQASEKIGGLLSKLATDVSNIITHSYDAILTELSHIDASASPEAGKALLNVGAEFKIKTAIETLEKIASQFPQIKDGLDSILSSQNIKSQSDLNGWTPPQGKDDEALQLLKLVSTIVNRGIEQSKKKFLHQ